METRWGSVGRFTIPTTSPALAVRKNSRPQLGLHLLVSISWLFCTTCTSVSLWMHSSCAAYFVSISILIVCTVYLNWTTYHNCLHCLSVSLSTSGRCGPAPATRPTSWTSSTACAATTRWEFPSAAPAGVFLVVGGEDLPSHSKSSDVRSRREWWLLLGSIGMSNTLSAPRFQFHLIKTDKKTKSQGFTFISQKDEKMEEILRVLSFSVRETFPWKPALREERSCLLWDSLPPGIFARS